MPKSLEERAAETEVVYLDGVTAAIPAGLTGEAREQAIAQVRELMETDEAFKARRERAAASYARFKERQQANQRALYEQLKARFEVNGTDNPADGPA